MHEFRSMVLKNKWTAWWVTGCLLLIAAGLVFSRAVLSIASVMIVVPFIFNASSLRNHRVALAGVALIILPVLVSGIWSENKPEWMESLLVRLPLLTIALGCIAISFSKKQWLLVSCVYVLVIFAGCCWSLWQYLANVEAVNASYLKAKVLPTLADQDYVRFSWMVMIGIVLAFKNALLIQPRPGKITMAVCIAFFVVYLHLLAAKTGLLCLYACFIMFIICFAVRRGKWKLALGLVMIGILVASLAYLSMPTLHNRIQYIRYDFSLYSKTGSAPGYNDAARWVSLRAGYELTVQHPLTGVGFGDMRSEVNRWHAQNMPASLPYEKFLPANEWLVYGTGSGITGVMMFTLGLIMLFYKTGSRQLSSVLLIVISIIPLLTDDTLEGQFGAVLLAFISFFAQQNPPPHE